MVDPDSKLEEEVIVRPTSETVIWSMYKKWINSYRDLPILINQWVNVVRWEMRTRLFLRTSEFLWQEGHTAHANETEAREETLKILDIYQEVAEKVLAIPVLTGLKSESERFAGAVDTYCIEAMMGDKRALQAGTSHYLGQNFAKAFDVKFKNENDMAEIREFLKPLIGSLEEKGVRLQLDDRLKVSPGFKFNEWEMKGVPIRVEAGPRDIESGTVLCARRDTGEKESLTITSSGEKLIQLLDEIQNNLYNQALEFREKNTFSADTYDEFKSLIEAGGFIQCGWDGNADSETAVKSETKATIRCILQDENVDDLLCIYSGNPAKYKVIFARAY